MSKPNIGKRILENVQSPTEENFDLLMDVVSRVLTSFSYLRITITTFLLAWLLVNTYFLLFKREEDDIEPVRIYYMHQLWFGDQSIVQILSNIWYYVILLLAFGPYFGQLVKFIKVYSISNGLI
jgi:hypothetical protein